MDKLATVTLQFDKLNDNLNYLLWKGLLALADNKSIQEAGNVMLVVLSVKGYSMADHQFIQIKTDVSNGKEIQLWIPRNFVKVIAEGKTDLSTAYTFMGTTK